MDPGRLSQGQLIAGAAAVLLFICLFLPWFATPEAEAILPSGEPVDVSGIEATANVDLGGESLSAWAGENPLDVYLMLTIVITLAGVALAARGGGGGATLMPLSAVTFLLGAIGTLLVAYQVFDPPGDYGKKFGLYLGVIAVAGIAVGGWLSMQDDASGGGRY